MGGRPITGNIVGKMRLIGGRLSAFNWSGRRLIAAAAVLHVVLAAGLFLAGRAQTAPGLIDRDGIMSSFAFDSYEYRRGAVRLVGILREGGVRAWAAERAPAHVKLISIQFALLGPLFGYGTLSAEPFNLFCYLAVLSLVYMLGREVGGRRAGLLSAGVVALWPTFFLHTTQLLKDPLFIAGVLALILIVTTWLTRTYDWRWAVGVGSLMAVTIWLLLLIRLKFGLVIFALLLFGFALLVVRQLLERRPLYWNMVCPLLVVAAGALAPLSPPPASQNLQHSPPGLGVRPEYVAGNGEQGPAVTPSPDTATSGKAAPATHAGRLSAAAENVALRIGAARYIFNISSPEAGSNIDRDVELRNFRDLVGYLPRAAEIGFWAPFPNTWAGAGKRVGSAGRLLSGAETFIIYLCQLLALIGVLCGPRRLAAWLLLSITTLGMTTLGLVVTNIGSLYRFRYTFWLLLIILGVKGLEGIVTAWGRGRRVRQTGEAG